MGRLWTKKAEWDNLARSKNVGECRALKTGAHHTAKIASLLNSEDAGSWCALYLVRSILAPPTHHIPTHPPLPRHSTPFPLVCPRVCMMHE